MDIQLIGLNHKTAPIELREKVSFSSQRLAQELAALSGMPGIRESVIISTCNRTELYACGDDCAAAAASLRQFLCSRTGLPEQEIREHCYALSGRQAVEHLFRVAASLDSMIVGETQIFGQVKDAYFKARECRTLGRTLDALFEEAIHAGKRVRTQTQIGKGAVSTSTAAIELARKIFDTLEGKQVLIIGAGKIGELTVKNLFSRGVRTVLVANRTLAKARELAAGFGGTAVSFEQIGQALCSADIVISSTSAPHYLVDKAAVEAVMRRRPQRSLFFIDLGMPRNIDPCAGQVENVYVYNIDDLAGVRDANIRERMAEAAKAERIVNECVEAVCSRCLSVS